MSSVVIPASLDLIGVRTQGSGTGYLSYLVSMLVGELGVNHGVELTTSLLEHSSRCIAVTDAKLGRKTDIQILQGNGLNVSADSGCVLHVRSLFVCLFVIEFFLGLLRCD